MSLAAIKDATTAGPEIISGVCTRVYVRVISLALNSDIIMHFAQDQAQEI